MTGLEESRHQAPELPVEGVYGQDVTPTFRSREWSSTDSSQKNGDVSPIATKKRNLPTPSQLGRGPKTLNENHTIVHTLSSGEIWN